MTVSATPAVKLDILPGEGDSLRLVLAGRLDASSVADIWDRTMTAVDAAKPHTLTVDGKSVGYCDGAGVGLLVSLRRRQRARSGEFELEGFPREARGMLELMDPASLEFSPIRPDRTIPIPEEVGRVSMSIARELGLLIAFVGELTVWLARSAMRPSLVRRGDMLRTAEVAGANALPIVMLIGFLMGLVIAFQSAGPMSRFGAELFITDIVAVSMLRELGPIMTAIVLAGRTASAFAAEIGAMKVKEEIDALTTMGLDPVRFLVVPRVLAAVVITPLLTIFANAAGIVGGGAVMLGLGYPLSAYLNQAVNAVTYVDLLGGLAKAFVFGVMIAAIGCFRGLRTRTGASAVGEATTSAVVSSIVLLAVADGVFSILYYHLGI